MDRLNFPFFSQLTDERPEDFRPSLRDDLFEEVIIEMIFLTDTRKDGVIDHEEFSNFLSLQSTPLSANQITEMKELFTSMASVTQDGVFYLHYNEFVGVVHQLITFLYQNMVPGQSVWVELPSTKVSEPQINRTPHGNRMSTMDIELFAEYLITSLVAR